MARDGKGKVTIYIKKEQFRGERGMRFFTTEIHSIKKKVNLSFWCVKLASESI